MKHLDIVEQANAKAKEIDQLLREMDATKHENMETVESKTQVHFECVLCLVNIVILYLCSHKIQTFKQRNR